MMLALAYCVVGTVNQNPHGLEIQLDAAQLIAEASSENPLSLQQVLDSVSSHQPKLEATMAKLRAAEGKAMSASGHFDPYVSAHLRRTQGGYYDLRQSDVELRQELGLWGAQVYGGFREGLGLDDDGGWPTYYSDETLSGGEGRIGLSLPLFRGGPIDPMRASIKMRRQELLAAEADLDLDLLELQVSAAKAYYEWAAAGHKVLIAKDLLRLAEERGAQLTERQKAGSVSRFEVSDNEQMIVARRADLVQATRAEEIASIQLGLYLRDDEGHPFRPHLEMLPPLRLREDADPDWENLATDLYACYPALRALRAEVEAIRTEYRLAQNQRVPDIRAHAELSEDFGPESRNPTLGGTPLVAGIKASIPLFMRKDRGKARAALAELEAAEANLEWAENQVEAAILDLRSANIRAHERAALAEGLVATRDALAKGERARFEAGASNLINVNIREQSAMKAAESYIDAMAKAQTTVFHWNQIERLKCGS